MAYQGFINLTPFAAEPLVLADERGRDLFTCIVKATFALSNRREGTVLSVAEEQMPVCMTPVHYGDPAKSSLKYEAETAPVKVGTDVALVGHAYATLAQATYLDVSVAVGPARAIVRVFGDRVWTSALGRWVPTQPKPFERMPLVYERAYGGWDRSSDESKKPEFEPRNPVGVGFVSKRRGSPNEGDPVPNLEDPYNPIQSPSDRPTPAGFGFIGAHWQPRTAYAGTYDDTWQQRRMPLLPQDFDRRFYSAAHPRLALQGFLRGGEPVEIVNASPHGILRFTLPTAQPIVALRQADGTIARAAMPLDTIVVNTDEAKLFLVWRASISMIGGIHNIHWAKAQLANGIRLT